MIRRWPTIIVASVGAAIIVGLISAAWARGGPEEQEKRVEESKVPAPALAMLKKMAGDAKILSFEEEIEHGHKYYEGSWKGPHGKIDVLVSDAGDLVEIEETVPPETLPKAVLDKARSAAGKDAKLHCEKKTVTLYEIHFRKGDRRHELVMSPEGREQEREEKQDGNDDD